MVITTSAAPAQRTALPSLFLAAAAMSATLSVTGAMGTIVAADLLGTTWAAVPNTAAIVGTGLGALLLTRLLATRGRRVGLTCGYGLAIVGAALAVAAVVRGDALGLVVGMLVLGLGNAAAQLSRYVAADLATDGARGRAIGALVWSGTLGGVGGPLLLGPLGGASTALGWSPAVGPFLFGLACVVLALGVARRIPVGRVTTVRSPSGPLLAPETRGPLLVMVTGQVVMVLVMTVTPLHMHHQGSGLGVVGTVLSVHVLGMFALAPLTGILADRHGPRPVMWAGLAVVAGSAALSAVPGDVVRLVVLFALGYGWNLCFVGGSSALAEARRGLGRSQIEGAVDAAVWLAAAVASLVSTLVLASLSMTGVAALGLLLTVPAAVALRRNPSASAGSPRA